MTTQDLSVGSLKMSKTVESPIQTNVISRTPSSGTIVLEVEREVSAAQALVVDQEPIALRLPYDFPKTPATGCRSTYYAFYLPDSLVAALNTQANSEGIGIDPILLAAFQTLLYRYTQQESIQFGLIRSSCHVDQEQITEICTVIDGDLKIRDLVERIRTVVDFNSHQDRQTPSDHVHCTDHLHCLARSSVMVTLLQNSSSFETIEQWLALFRERNCQFLGNLDLHLVLLQSDQGISGVIEYNVNLLQPNTIQRLEGHLRTLLGGIATSLDRTIAQLPLLTQLEQQQLLVTWKSPSVDHPQLPIYHYIETHAIHNPDAVALNFKDQQLTYSQLNQRANQLAHYLNRLGVEMEDRVAVCLQPCLEIAVVLLGIFKAGATYVPLDPTHPMDRLTAILKDTQPQILLTQSSLLPNLPAIAPQTLCLEEWQTLQHLPTHNPSHPIQLDQTSHVIYTSGTTGKPKGVMTSHRNLVNYILVAQEQYGFNHNDVMPAIARFSFSITMFELLSPLVAGGRLVILEREHILDFKRMVETLEQVTVVHASPSLFQKLLVYIKDNQIEIERFQGLRHASSGGDMVSAELLARMKNTFQHAEIYVIYGCSEVSCMGCTYPVSRDQTITKSQVGKPFSNVSVRLYDAAGNLVPIGVAGEIYIGGSGVTQGYLNRQELTQEKFITIDGERFYRTGDVGRYDADGNLEMLGRSDFQIKLRGIRIELGEIESALRRAPGVREGVVMARELGNSEKSLVAYVVLDRAENQQIEQIRQFLRMKLPDYMLPAAFVVLDALPVNMNQKVDRRALPMPTLQNLTGAIVPPRDETERQLIEIWEAVLGIQPIGIRNNFFELGGDSLLAVQMLAQIEQVLGQNLPITTLLHAFTIEDLVKVLQNSEAEVGTSDLVALRSSGSKTPLFCMYGVLLYQELVNHLDPDRPVYGVFLQEEVELIKTGKFDPTNSAFTSVPGIAARYVQAIRTLQPHGPYHLAGESFGGVVAYEMAQQLQASGEEVAIVALFDAWMSNGYAGMPTSQRLKLHVQLLSKHRLSYCTRIIQRRMQTIQQSLSAQLYQMYQQVQTWLGGLPQVVSESTQNDIRAEVRERASQTYIPQPYSGKILLFRAKERDAFEVDQNQDMGWGALATGGLHIFDIPGDHLGILKAPNVAILAEKLQLHLD